MLESDSESEDDEVSVQLKSFHDSNEQDINATTPIELVAVLVPAIHEAFVTEDVSESTTVVAPISGEEAVSVSTAVVPPMSRRGGCVFIYSGSYSYARAGSCGFGC